MKRDGSLVAVKGDEVYRLPEEDDEFKHIERMEESSILKTITQGIVENQYCYQFKSRGERVIDLTWQGIFAIAQHMGGIHVDITQVTKEDGSYLVVASAHDRIRDLKMPGAASQPIRMQNGQEDEFALAKAVRKASRNALKGLLPVPLVRSILKHYIERKEDMEVVAKREAFYSRAQQLGLDAEKVIKHLEEQAGEPSSEWDSERWQRACAFLVTKGKTIA